MRTLGLVLALGLAARASVVTDQMRSDAQRIIEAAFSNESLVYSRLSFMCDTIGPRLSGSQALEDALDWIAGQVAADGLSFTEEPVMVPTWVRGNEYLKMLEPRVKMMHMVGLGGSVRTDPENSGAPTPLVAQVFVTTSFDDLKAAAARNETQGKIILFNVPFVSYGATVAYRVGGGAAAQAAGGVAALVRSVTPFSLQSPHTGGGGTSGIPVAAVSIEDALQIARMTQYTNVTLELYMEAQTLPDSPSRNIVITMPGTDLPNEFVVIGGHIDSWDISEGAMDDGGGAFAAWEAVRILTTLGIRPRRTIRAVFFVNEENGGRGGQAYAADHAAELPNTSIAIENDEGTFTPFRLSFTGSAEAIAIVQDLATLLAPIGAGNVSVGGSGADIGPMCQTGVPCAALEVLDPRLGLSPINACRDVQPNEGADPGAWLSSDTILGGIPSGYFWFHHTASDTIDKVDPVQLQGNAAAFAIWAYGFASIPTLLPRTGPAATPTPTPTPTPAPTPGFLEDEKSRIVAVGVTLTVLGALVAFATFVFGRRSILVRLRQPVERDAIITAVAADAMIANSGGLTDGCCPRRGSALGGLCGCGGGASAAGSGDLGHYHPGSETLPLVKSPGVGSAAAAAASGDDYHRVV